jgi:hypothetical protein
MSYDPIKTQTLIRGSERYRQMPNSEFIMEVVDQLKSADLAISGWPTEAQKFRDAITGYERDSIQSKEAFRLVNEEKKALEVTVRDLRAKQPPEPKARDAAAAPAGPVPPADAPAGRRKRGKKPASDWKPDPPTAII